MFLIGSLVWMVAILLDKNRVFPKWFGYLSLCNALTEVVVAPAWIFRRGVFAWNGAIAWWINMVVFVLYTVVFIVLLRKMIEREDFGTGPLPDLPRQRSRRRIRRRSMTDLRLAPADRREAGQIRARSARHVDVRSVRDAALHRRISRSTWSPGPTIRELYPAVPGASGSAHRRLQHPRLAAELLVDRAMRPSVPGRRVPVGADGTSFSRLSSALVFLVSKVVEWVTRDSAWETRSPATSSFTTTSS